MVLHYLNKGSEFIYLSNKLTKLNVLKYEELPMSRLVPNVVRQKKWDSQGPSI